MNTYQIIKELANQHKISISELERKLNLSNGSISKWAKSKPNSKYIEKVKYTGNSDINVYVNGGFKELSESEKTEVLNQVQSLAKMVLVQNSKISSSEAGKGLILEAFNGKNSVAVSKISNHKSYHFTN